MKVTYIHHSSFSVELQQTVLLFDYYKGELPEFPKEKPLIVFASHFHQDHYSPVIFELAERRDNIYYVLSKDIKKRSVPENVRFVKAGERFSLSLGSPAPFYQDPAEPVSQVPSVPAISEKSALTMEIETFLSTDEGVAFWITCEGKQIYHAGDLNNWWWEGEDKAWNHNMAANYRREIDKMAGRHADAAFVPLDPRLEQWFYLGMDEFMKKVNADNVFPMHFWNDYGIIEKMKQLPLSESYRERIVEIHREGEEFEL